MVSRSEYIISVIKAQKYFIKVSESDNIYIILDRRLILGCVNLSFAYIEGESLLMALKDIALSSGSACTSASLEPSYVLRAIGADEDLAHSSIRFGIGRFTTEEVFAKFLSNK